MGASQPRITETDYYAFAMVGGWSSPPSTTNTPANTVGVASTQRGSALPTYTPRVFNHPPAAGGHRPQSTGRPQAAATYVARAGRARLADRDVALLPTLPPPPPHLNSSDLGPGSVPARTCPGGRSRPAPQPPRAPSRPPKRCENPHPAQIAVADSVHLHHSNAELIKGSYANSAMGRDAGGSGAPVTASPAAVQQQKPKAVSGGRGTAGRPA